MIGKAYLAFIGVIAISTAAAAGIIAACYALFAALAPWLGPAGASGLVAAAVFLIIGLIGLMIAAGTGPRARAKAEQDLPAKLIQLARDKPIVAVGAMIAAGVVLARNPKIVATAVTAFMAGRGDRKS
ncbi:hypothetical protein [Phenylobacterium sp.]|uniref:hypothetical protein n=1 Tax=Phenylobacterium sp. TaxID=1871053 RepID=UPI0035B45FC0